MSDQSSNRPLAGKAVTYKALARIFHNPVRLHDPCRLWRF
jgi:hypothetical protein